MARGRLSDITGHRSELLAHGWQLTSASPDAIADPAQLAEQSGSWVPATVPCTAASALRAAGLWSLDDVPRRFDAEDWWFRTSFRTERSSPGEQIWLSLGGLATVADVWLNGAPLVRSMGMFRARECRIDDRLAGLNELVIRFRSLDALLKPRRPRPRWRTPMVEHQQLRWFRTTLLGRTPGWSPPAAPVGPWRPITIQRRRGIDFSDFRLNATGDGRLEIAVRIGILDGVAIDSVELVLHRAGQDERIPLAGTGDVYNAQTVVRSIEPWWPHTHGQPTLYDARLEVRRRDAITRAELGAIGFRSVRLDTTGGDFKILINDVPMFCRGACWTPIDVVSLDASEATLDQAFSQVRQCGMNMLRVGGTMVYESDAFLNRCDANGVLLWQDFMFANMDYPHSDRDFASEVTEEVVEQLDRFQGRPSLTLLCGNSEGEQQAAMWGAPRDQWAHPLFSEQIATLARERCPDVPYWPSSTHGGAFPHQGNTGSASYYGVGAYLRPLEDARRAEVRFASECLAFANIPEDAALDRLPTPYRLRAHHPIWKSRAPRDLGAGWDFDDVRDHYLELLFDVDSLALRYADHERYLELGRVATGIVMASTFLEWRRRRSITRGGLIWFLRDLWAGVGWGVIDADGNPKPAWHYLRRALAPLTVGLSDEGTNGLAVEVTNDHADIFSGTLDLACFHRGQAAAGSASTPLVVDGRSGLELNAVSLLPDFQDLSYAYRFGPPPHDVVVATLRDSAGTFRGRAVHYIGRLPNQRLQDVGLKAEIQVGARGLMQLTIRTRVLAEAVRVEVPGYFAEDNYFHLLPGEERHLALHPVDGATPTEERPGIVRALNSEIAARVLWP